MTTEKKEREQTFYRVKLLKPIPRSACKVFPPGNYPDIIGMTGQRMWAFQEWIDVSETHRWVLLTESGRAILIVDQKHIAEFITSVTDPKGNRLIDKSDYPKSVYQKLQEQFRKGNANV